MTRAASGIAAAALVAVVWVVLHLGWYPHGQLVDYPTYKSYGYAVTRGHEVPYRDFRLEYPPAALPTFILPAWLTRFDYRNVFQGEMAFCHLLLVLSVLAVAGRRAAAFAAVAPLLLGSVVLSRYDLWPTALTALALAALVRRWNAASALALGTAFAAKLWPAILAPLVVVWLARRQGRRAAATWSAVAAAVALVWFVPFAIVAPHGILHSFHEQFGRPLQIESLGAVILVALHDTVGTSVGTTSSFGSQNLTSSGAEAMGIATTVVEAAALLAVWWAYLRGDSSTRRLFTAAAAAVTALLAFGKVFSPQYLIWLIPLVLLADSVVASAVFALALVLTQLYFPRRYWDYAVGLHRPDVAIVLARNVVVVALFVVLAVRVARRRDGLASPASEP